MSDSPYIPFYTSDFLGGTSGMTASTKGVYITLLCLMYEAEAPLAQKQDVLARRCGCTLPAFRRALEALTDEKKIEVTAEGIWSQKCEKHLTQRRERQRSAKAAAKRRWEKTQQNQGKADASAMRAQCQPEPEPERDTNVSLSKRARPERFQEFWDQYPHRGGAKKNRGKCETKYARHIAAGVSEQEIINGALRYATDRQVLEGYAKNPETWLNNEGWKDDVEPVTRPPRHPGGGGALGSLYEGFAAYANEGDSGGDTTAFDPGGEEMDCGAGVDASQPILRLIGSG